ncbi:MAG: FAD dependent oxidoreductase [Candidatus Woesebacteria bacterium GW2011_GWB1_45_5]|uniref:FAD dependent oxidoreductase n=1 Tax=Candidatus Woesebacteria bacterium GW2011_GWB1_45_5 TaxID=1618581 RepID=A0A0G1QQL4_9BACT|nr:MAG: FAD dependent oxidoreductase [Candidatus Woesebacteria bacterium GW2011_GWB1_45_5]
MRASYINQARIHNGYHYPRSFLTAVRSNRNYKNFLKDYGESVFSKFKQYYAIAAINSKTTSRQFVKFCEQIKAPLKEAPENIKKLFNPTLTENVFEAEEVVYDAKVLQKSLTKKLKTAKIKVFLGERVVGVKPAKGEGEEKVEVSLAEGKKLVSKTVFNCTYSQINKVLVDSGLPPLPLKQEYIEMPIIRIPPEMENIGVTIMDGPFFGFLPFPDKDAHSLWHVRYAIHANWDEQKQKKFGLDTRNFNPESNYPFMIRDMARFIPALARAKYLESLYEIKAVLVDREESDGRPILFRKDYGIKNFHVVMGSKIDNIYDALEKIKEEII